MVIYYSFILATRQKRSEYRSLWFYLLSRASPCLVAQLISFSQDCLQSPAHLHRSWRKVKIAVSDRTRVLQEAWRRAITKRIKERAENSNFEVSFEMFHEPNVYPPETIADWGLRRYDQGQAKNDIFGKYSAKSFYCCNLVDPFASSTQLWSTNCKFPATSIPTFDFEKENHHVPLTIADRWPLP